MIKNVFGNKVQDASVSSDVERQRRYETLVHAWHKDLYRYAFWLTKDASIAEDLVQETFLRAWRSLDSLLDENAAKSWLITILRRENARRFARKQLELVDIDENPIPIEYDIDDEHDSENDKHKLIHKYLIQLSPEYRDPLVLQVIAGFNGDEIAQILDINKNTVMTRLFRARNQLKEFIDKHHPEIRGTQHGRA